MSEIGGVWRTIGGRRVFIKDGQDLASAMKESGKFTVRNIEYKENPNIKTSEKFDKTIDAKISKDIMQYTNELYQEYSDILPARTIIWKTFVTKKTELANSNYNLNPSLANNYNDFIKLIVHNQDLGQLVKTDNPIKQIVAHEVGHNVQTELYKKVSMDKIKSQKGADKYTKKMMMRVVDRFEQENPNIMIREAVSEYGAENYYELFSEAFAEYTSSKTPRPFAQIFGIILEEEREKIHDKSLDQ